MNINGSNSASSSNNQGLNNINQNVNNNFDARRSADRSNLRLDLSSTRNRAPMTESNGYVVKDYS